MLIIYTAFLYFFQPIIWVRLWIRGRNSAAYRQRWGERYGFCAGKVKTQGILLHAVSVGETFTAIPLIRELNHRYPHLPIVITTMTPTGSHLAVSSLGNMISHVYLPYDLPGVMNRFFDVIRPKLVIVMETELWPNMITLLYTRRIPLIIANARLSERSAKMYKIFGTFTKSLFQRITLVAAQSKEDSEHFINLGIQQSRVVVTGSLKFDVTIMPELTKKAIQLKSNWILQKRSIWIAASTHHGEEQIILKAHSKLLERFPDLLLILAPRHPERFSSVRYLTQQYRLRFILRSNGQTPSDSTQVVIGDTIGELMLLYAISDLAFVGGSLVKHGGHNPLEPAAHTIPILMGPHTFNFKDICHLLQQSNALITVTDAESLSDEITALLTDKSYRLNAGLYAFNVLHKNKGALKHLLQLIQPYLSQEDD
ncbi:lipid IV(A) 3-deoxy-D-manno-octulosonic acid transferase [Candidatus Erwinia haradaeae]|uniref:3-deoxy-D-manno-octulosonic acid transferase n=1 Tax=Candidatus Erwinia haradaeae TaxID=1922217 RepID=A0A451DKP9_9GAMM|nr:lipid IV(A) 3-deoxy-D-manno-octulosonic acid transferase [Candidatus Erwinia haradaeae]VFP87296.1 3-deoxy-D-manno-octulosonic acid transferase [Candidatus Erwinia haradaeae]